MNSRSDKEFRKIVNDITAEVSGNLKYRYLQIGF
jgi:hypothetical protein